eukprot:scaffold77429_cov36-Tisochrysis_lutea.AAC.3
MRGGEFPFHPPKCCTFFTVIGNSVTWSLFQVHASTVSLPKIVTRDIGETPASRALLAASGHVPPLPMVGTESPAAFVDIT